MDQIEKDDKHSRENIERAKAIGMGLSLQLIDDEHSSSSNTVNKTQKNAKHKKAEREKLITHSAPSHNKPIMDSMTRFS